MRYAVTEASLGVMPQTLAWLICRLIKSGALSSATSRPVAIGLRRVHHGSRCLVSGICACGGIVQAGVAGVTDVTVASALFVGARSRWPAAVCINGSPAERDGSRTSEGTGSLSDLQPAFFARQSFRSELGQASCPCRLTASLRKSIILTEVALLPGLHKSNVLMRSCQTLASEKFTTPGPRSCSFDMCQAFQLR